MYIIYVLMYIFIYVVQILITQLSFHVKSISMMFQQQTDKHADTFLLDTLSLTFYNPLIEKYVQNLWLTSPEIHH